MPPAPRLAAYGMVELMQQAPLLSQLPHWFPGGGLPSDTPLVMEEYGQQCGPCQNPLQSQASLDAVSGSAAAALAHGSGLPSDTWLVVEEYGQQ